MTTDRQKIVCHATGDRCHGCAHYRGKADVCEYAEAAADTDYNAARDAHDRLMADYQAAQDRIRRLESLLNTAKSDAIKEYASHKRQQALDAPQGAHRDRCNRMASNAEAYAKGIQAKQDDSPHVPGSVVDELLKAMHPLLVARGYIHKDDIEPLLLEAQKCYSRDGFHEFAAKHWPGIRLTEDSK